MFRNMLAIIVYICCISSISAYAFNDQITHRKLTEKAVDPKYSNIDNYLVNVIGFSSGTEYILNGIDRKGYNQKYPVNKWLQEGSTDEDALNICRASNHFHDPLRPGGWMTSQMSDSGWVDALCGTTKRYSDVTWATGYRSPYNYIGERTGQYLEWTGLSDAPQDMGWDGARLYFYDALTATVPAVREEKFVKTFKAVGQVLHLLQDMAVPAHVRNDMESHLFNDINPNNWSNPLEKYVVINDSAINIDPNQYKPTFGASPRVTDFWDKDVYTGANPDSGTNQGLAEYANANFFSGSTIPQNNPSTEHRFPYPQITNANYICTDKLPGSTKMTKYVSRTACPTDGSPVDHFAAVSLLNSKGTAVSTIKKVWLDNNVHDTYAQQILPKAVGYSSALLDYFFRGKLEASLSTQNPSTSSTMRLMLKNATPGEQMTGGKLALVLRYRQLAESGATLVSPSQDADFSYMVIELPSQTVSSGAATEYAFSLPLPLPIWTKDLAAQVVYRGALGNEADAVAVSPWNPLQYKPDEIELKLPAAGVYAATTGATPFSEIRLNARNNLPTGETMTDGTISLYLLYRTATADPFQSVAVTSLPADGYNLVKVPEKNNTRTLPTGSAVELVFDLSAVPLPLWATDVYLYVVYQGTLTNGVTTKPNATVVGMIDIAEPTPVDAYNNTDYTCLNNTWYRYDDPAAMTIVDSNSNGIADRSDIYPHSISNIAFQGGPADAGALTASPQQNNLSAAGPLQPGQMLRLGYILTDYANRFAFDEQWTNNSAQDSWTTTSSTTMFTGTGFLNQVNKGFGGMYNMRGSKMWWGASVIYENDSYPAGSYCDWNALP